MVETSYYRGDYIYANQKPCGNNRERATLFYNKEIHGKGLWPRGVYYYEGEEA